MEQLVAIAVVVWSDLKIAVRRLRISPVFSLLFVITLGGALGAAAAVQALLDNVFRPPLGFPDPGGVVNIYASSLERGTAAWQWQFSEDDFHLLANQLSTCEGLLAWRRFRAEFESRGPSAGLGEAVTTNYFQVLRVRPAVGRLFAGNQPSDDVPPLVLSYDTWDREFQRDPAVIGGIVRLGHRPFRLIGVAEQAFRGLDVPAFASTSAWVVMNSEFAPGEPVDPFARMVFVRGRLKPGETVVRLRMEMSAIAGRLSLDVQREAGALSSAQAPELTAVPATDVLLHESVHGYSRQALRLIRWTLVVVVLVACVNLAGLQASRIGQRSADVAIRTALGAGAWRILSVLTAEIAVLVLLSGAVGFALTLQLCALATTTVDLGGGLMLRVAPVVGRNAMTVLVLSVFAALFVAGVIPAWQVVRSGKGRLVAVDAHTVPRWTGRRIVIAGQVCVAVVMMAMASSFFQTALQVLHHDFGIDYAHMVMVHLRERETPSDSSSSELRFQMDAVLRRFEIAAGFDAVAAVSGLPIGFPLDVATIARGDNRAALHPAIVFATGNIERALGVRLISGTVADSTRTMPAAVITEKLAGKLFGERSALGGSVDIVDEQHPELRDLPIIGVIADTEGGPPASQASGLVVVLTPGTVSSERIIIARAERPDASAPIYADAVRRAAPLLDIVDVRNGPDVLRATQGLPRFAAVVTLCLAALSTLLCVAGLAGIVSHNVSSRTREIGIRVALGASRTGILRKVIADGMSPVFAGFGIGAPIAGIASAFIAAALPSIGALPGWAFFAIPGVVLAAAVAACAAPARRAAGIEPAVALRDL